MAGVDNEGKCVRNRLCSEGSIKLYREPSKDSCDIFRSLK